MLCSLLNEPERGRKIRDLTRTVFLKLEELTSQIECNCTSSEQGRDIRRSLGCMDKTRL